MRIAYITSRFPSSSETFIARELNHVSAFHDIEVEVHSLFPATENLVHPSAEPWLDKVRRPTAGEGLRDLAWWLIRKPLTVADLFGTVVTQCIRHPGYMARSLATLPMAASIARRLDETGADHVHAHYATYPALAAWACRRLTGVTYSFTVHAHDVYVTQAMLAEKVRNAAFIDAISEYNREFLREYGGDLETPVHVIHCGIELELYDYRPRRAPDSGPIEALCVASLQEHKGQRVLLEAIATEDNPLARIRLTLVGAGPERPALEAQAKALGIAERVEFAGSQPEDEVRQRLSETHIFVLPSLVARDGQMEGLPVALMESLACGIPTVASNLSGIPEIVRDGKTGYVAEPGDPESLREALGRSVSGGIDTAAARLLVEDEFSVSKSASVLRRLFRESGRT